jgi:cobalt/nickel transport system permease protein
VIVLTCVVGVQALIFQDGGLVALGANIFNMGVVGVFVAYGVYRTIQRLAGGRQWGVFAGGFVAAWASILMAGLTCALELALSGTSPANVAAPAMGGIHALIGVGEGLITLGALAFLWATRRDLFKAEATQAVGGKAVWIGGLVIAGVLAIASPLASSHPDGLEWVAAQKGFIETARAPLFNIVPGYVMPGVPNEALATILAGIVGTLLVFGVAFGVARLRRTPGVEHKL